MTNTTHGATPGIVTPVTGLDESNIPPALLPKARAWFTKQLEKLERAHGPSWPKHREWLCDYLNEELREHVTKREKSNAI